MQVKLIDHGVPANMLPKRAYANDVGADVYALRDQIVEIGCSAVIGRQRPRQCSNNISLC